LNQKSAYNIQTIGTPYNGMASMLHQIAWLSKVYDFGSCGTVTSLLPMIGSLETFLMTLKLRYTPYKLAYYRTTHKTAPHQCSLTSFFIPGNDDGIVADEDSRNANGLSLSGGLTYHDINGFINVGSNTVVKMAKVQN
jgi:hypothetical protein